MSFKMGIWRGGNDLPGCKRGEQRKSSTLSLCSVILGNSALGPKMHSSLSKINVSCVTWPILLKSCFFFSFIFISWRLITLQYCSGFVIHWHESAMDLRVFPIPIPPPTSLSTQSLWVFPVHQARAFVSRIPPGLVICFTIDNIHVSMLFSQNIPPSPSPSEPKSLFCT